MYRRVPRQNRTRIGSQRSSYLGDERTSAPELAQPKKRTPPLFARYVFIVESGVCLFTVW
jgi:hypothetical protein